jgi:hypothetical protein
VSDDDEIAAELLEEVDLRTVSIIWNDTDDRPDISFSGCSIYEAIGLCVTGMFRLMGAEQWPADEDEEEDDE